MLGFFPGGGLSLPEGAVAVCPHSRHPRQFGCGKNDVVAIAHSVDSLRSATSRASAVYVKWLYSLGPLPC